MDIVESLAADFDRLRDLTIDYTLSESPSEREQRYRELSRYQNVTARAQAAVIDASEAFAPIEFAIRAMLKYSDEMDAVAMTLARSNRRDVQAALRDVYSDLVIQRLSDFERQILPHLYECVAHEDRRRMGAMYVNYRDIALDLDLGDPAEKRFG